MLLLLELLTLGGIELFMLCGFELLTLSGGITLGSIGSLGLLDRLEDELLDGCGVEFFLLTSSPSSLSSSIFPYYLY